MHIAYRRCIMAHVSNDGSAYGGRGRSVPSQLPTGKNLVRPESLGPSGQVRASLHLREERLERHNSSSSFCITRVIVRSGGYHSIGSTQDGQMNPSQLTQKVRLTRSSSVSSILFLSDVASFRGRGRHRARIHWHTGKANGHKRFFVCLLPFHTELPECYSYHCFLCMSKSGKFLRYAFRYDCSPAKET